MMCLPNQSVAAPRLLKLVFVGTFVFWLLLSGQNTFAADGGPAAAMRNFLETRCYDCHQGDSADAGLDLEKVSFDLGAGDNLQRWIRIYDRVETGEMPPADHSTLAPAVKDSFLSITKQGITHYQHRLHSEYGRVRGRRLTRKQIERSLQDLLAIDIPLLDLLPEEHKTAGFTTVASGQGMSLFQISAHLNTVDAALDEAFRRALSADDNYVRDFDANGVARTNPKARCREPEMRNGKAIIWSSGLIYYGRMPATTAPADGWYDFEVTVSGIKLPQTGGVWSTVSSGPCVASAPLLAKVTTFEAMKDPKVVKFTTWLPKGHMLEIRPADASLKKGRFANGQVGAGEGESQDLAGIAFDRVQMKRVHLNGDDQRVRQMLFGNLQVKPSADKKKPYQLISKSPEEDLERLVTAFAQRAFRHPVNSLEMAPFLEEARTALGNGGDLIDALRLGYRSVLCSPRFLYFTEAPGTLDDYAMATRLSYLLTGSTPDEKLSELAAAGKLHDPEVLKSETRRLLAGDGGKRFVEDFAAEWLDLDQISFTDPDPRLYRDFDPVVEQAMLKETEAFLQTMLEENLSVDHLIDADFTFLNSRLARFYGIEEINGDELRRVDLAWNSHRGGVLTQGAILKVTANGSNTSPVVRGVWVSERLLGIRVPPPPSNVPAVEPDIRGAKTIRQQLAKHRSQGECASCHAKFDPAGFALENYDPAGQWRDTYLQVQGSKTKKGLPIDSSYELPDGQKFKDVKGFQKLYKKDSRPVAENVAEQLVTYGTGATVTFVDREEIGRIVDRTSQDNFGLRSIVEAVVTSPVFMSK